MHITGTPRQVLFIPVEAVVPGDVLQQHELLQVLEVEQLLPPLVGEGHLARHGEGEEVHEAKGFVVLQNLKRKLN